MFYPEPCGKIVNTLCAVRSHINVEICVSVLVINFTDRCIAQPRPCNLAPRISPGYIREILNRSSQAVFVFPGGNSNNSPKCPRLSLSVHRKSRNGSFWRSTILTFHRCPEYVLSTPFRSDAKAYSTCTCDLRAILG